MLCTIFLHSRLKLQDQDSEAHVRAIVAITTLLKNAPELGSSQIGKDGITQIMLTMAQSDDKVQQIVAAEAIIAACAKKKDTISIISHVSTVPIDRILSVKNARAWPGSQWISHERNFRHPGQLKKVKS